MPFEQASALIGVQTFALRVLNPAGVLLTGAALVYYWRATRRAAIITSPAFMRVAAIGALLISITVALRAISQLPVYLLASQTGTFPFVNPVR
jgi:hypothetical protein